MNGERYKVQFTASQEYVDLLERAQDLLSHAVPDRSLEAVHLRALRLLGDRLEKRKYGAPRQQAHAGSKAQASSTALEARRRWKLDGAGRLDGARRLGTSC